MTQLGEKFFTTFGIPRNLISLIKMCKDKG